MNWCRSPYQQKNNPPEVKKGSGLKDFTPSRQKTNEEPPPAIKALLGGIGKGMGA